MISEKDMENAIANNPKKYLGEQGLELVERQYRIGGYIFDLMFKDRFGAKMIVEIQKGTLDREHTYKILDYYDGFREKNPEEFIELMVIANKVPEERKKRLRSWGVEFREIPVVDFISETPADLFVLPHPACNICIKVVKKSHDGIDEATKKSYQLFKEQKNRFVEELLHIDKGVKVCTNWNELSEHNINTHKNWFIGFVPRSWGAFKAGRFGIHFEFCYHRDKKTGIEYVRFPVGVEKPLKPEFHDEFKKDVAKSLKEKNIKLSECAIWPDVGFRGRKLIEPTLVELDTNTWEKVFNQYLTLGEFVQVVANVIKEYHNTGCFTEPLIFS